MNLKTTATITLCVLGPVLLPLLFGADLALTLIILACFLLLGAWILRLMSTDKQTEEEKNLKEKLDALKTGKK